MKLSEPLTTDKYMQIDKNDIIVLDFIIQKIVGSDLPLRSQTLKEAGYLNIDDEELRELEFTRLINIISYKGVGKTTSSKYNYDSIRRNENSMKFKELGGFKKYFQDELEKKEKAENLEKLKMKNLVLENENLEFSQTIREQESKIRALEFKIKRIELIKSYWWFIVFCILLGGFLKEILNIITSYIRK